MYLQQNHEIGQKYLVLRPGFADNDDTGTNSAPWSRERRKGDGSRLTISGRKAMRLTLGQELGLGFGAIIALMIFSAGMTNVGDAQTATENLAKMASQLRVLVGSFKVDADAKITVAGQALKARHTTAAG